MWRLFLLFTFLIIFSVRTVNTDNEDSESLAVRLNNLEAAIDYEIQKTNDLLYLIDKRSLVQRAASACNQVAFHSVLTTSSVSVSSSNDVIKFNNVITNVGGGYNRSTGIFTAPVSGYYEFIVTIMAQSGSTFISKLLINTSDYYCHAYGSSRSQAQGMCNMVHYLSQGYTAKVTTYSGSALYGNGFSSFSGHLIG